MTSKGDMEVGDPANNVPVSHESTEKCARRAGGLSILLRLTAAPLCAIALALTVTNKETHIFEIDATTSVYKKAKYSGLPALVYFVIINGIAAGYHVLQALISLVPCLNKNYNYYPSRVCLWLTFLLDQFLLYALIAAAAATTQVAYMAEHGNNASNWAEVCSYFGKFCNRMIVSLVIGFIAILVLIVLAAVSAHQLFSSASRRPYGGKATTGGAPKNFGSR